MWSWRSTDLAVPWRRWATTCPSILRARRCSRWASPTTTTAPFPHSRTHLQSSNLPCSLTPWKPGWTNSACLTCPNICWGIRSVGESHSPCSSMHPRHGRAWCSWPPTASRKTRCIGSPWKRRWDGRAGPLWTATLRLSETSYAACGVPGSFQPTSNTLPFTTRKTTPCGNWSRTPGKHTAFFGQVATAPRKLGGSFHNATCMSTRCLGIETPSFPGHGLGRGVVLAAATSIF